MQDATFTHLFLALLVFWIFLSQYIRQLCTLCPLSGHLHMDGSFPASSGTLHGHPAPHSPDASLPHAPGSFSQLSTCLELFILASAFTTLPPLATVFFPPPSHPQFANERSTLPVFPSSPTPSHP